MYQNPQLRAGADKSVFGVLRDVSRTKSYDFPGSEFRFSCVSLFVGSIGFQTFLVTCITSYNCASCSGDICSNGLAIDVGSFLGSSKARLFEHRGVESLTLIRLAARTSWQLVQIHLPLSQEPHYVYRICDVLVSTEL